MNDDEIGKMAADFAKLTKAMEKVADQIAAAFQVPMAMLNGEIPRPSVPYRSGINLVFTRDTEAGNDA